MFINLLNFNSIRSSVYKSIEFRIVSSLVFINLFLLVDPAAGDAADESGSSAPPRQQS